MGCDWMSCGNCNRAFNWTFADCCHRCDNDDNFICDRCCKCCECGKSESDNLSECELTEKDTEIVDKLRLSQITTDNMTDEELLKRKINEIRQVTSNYKVLLNLLDTEKNTIVYRIRKKLEETKKVKELEDLKLQKELEIKKLEKELEDMRK